MAYPTVSAPYGFKPYNLIGGRVFAGSTRQLPIAIGNATAIYTGDIVIMSSNGTVTLAVLTATAVNVAGIFLGCSYLNSAGQRIYAQYIPATIPTGNSDTVYNNQVWAYVADDPLLVMKVAVVSGTTTMSAHDRTNVGNNVPFVANAGSTITGDSAMAILSTAATTTTLPLRIVDVVPDTVQSNGSYTEFLVMWNPVVHMYTGPAGV